MPVKVKNYRHLFALGLGFILTAAAYLWFISSAAFPAFKSWSSAHGLLLFLFLVFIKIVGIVWPPLPGGIFTFGSIPVIGWQSAYLADLIGSTIGSSIAYLLARRFGAGFVAKILDEASLSKIQKVRIPKKHEFEAVFVFRLFGSTILELICYAAGLLKVRYSTFLLASTASHLVIGIPFYYFGDGLFGENAWVSALLFLGCVFIFFLLRKRYFTLED